MESLGLFLAILKATTSSVSIGLRKRPVGAAGGGEREYLVEFEALLDFILSKYYPQLLSFPYLDVVAGGMMKENGCGRDKRRRVSASSILAHALISINASNSAP